MNLVQTIMQMLTPAITNRIASTLGLSPAIVSRAIGALVPALLMGLANKSATAAGAKTLAGTLAQQNSTSLESLTASLGTAGQASSIASASASMAALLGNNAMATLTSALSKFSGTDQRQSGSLIGMLTPLIFGRLTKAQSAQALEGAAVARFLSDQKPNIAAALPAEFNTLLANSPFAVATQPTAKTSAVPIPSRPIQRSATPVEERPIAQRSKENLSQNSSAEGREYVPSTRREPSMLPYVLGIAVIFGLIAILARPSYRSSTYESAVMPSATQTAATTTGAQPADENTKYAINIAHNFIGELSAALLGINDQNNAQAALPLLTASATSLDQIDGYTKTIPPAGKSQVAALLSAAMPQLAAQIDAVRKKPELESVIKPVLDRITTRLDQLTKA